MDNEKLRTLLQTTEGLEGMLGLLSSVYYQPRKKFWSGRLDRYTVDLRNFVDRVLAALPESNHQALSDEALELFMAGNQTAEELETIASRVKEGAHQTELVRKLRWHCRRLKTDLIEEEEE